MRKWIALAALLGACGKPEPSAQCKAARADVVDALRRAAHRVTVKGMTIGEVTPYGVSDPKNAAEVAISEFSKIQAEDSAAMDAAEKKRAADAPGLVKDLTEGADALQHDGDLLHAKTASDALAAWDRAAYDTARKGCQAFQARVDALEKQVADALPAAKAEDTDLLASTKEQLKNAHDLYDVRIKLEYFDREMLPLLLDQARDACR